MKRVEEGIVKRQNVCGNDYGEVKGNHHLARQKAFTSPAALPVLTYARHPTYLI